ncbi:hypothetical protein COOONC_25781, partial [Cooperia oncophora]
WRRLIECRCRNWGSPKRRSTLFVPDLLLSLPSTVTVQKSKNSFWRSAVVTIRIALNSKL